MAYLLQHLLTGSAARFPDREAVRFDGRPLTYRELDSLSDRLARTLSATGVRPGDRVGIWVPKSPASVIGLFGVLKAGAVCVPLDPSAPPKRLAYIARNCDIRVLVTSAGVAGLPALLAEETPVTAVVLTDAEAARVGREIRVIGWDEVARQDDGPPPSPGTIETDLAYILYTSGSTGEPKGVMISHRAILTFVDWCHDTFGMTPADRVTSHAPLHFDLSTFDVYATVKAGGTIVLVPERLSVFPGQLAGLLEDERITITYLVPSVLALMVTYGDLASRRFESLRAVLFAGEVFPIKHLRRLAEAIPHAAYFNLYGPTETNVCTYYRVRPEDLAPDRTQPVPIGVACEDVAVFAVDDAGRPVSRPGDEGELWVRGPGLAQGYWGDPEKTAGRFVANPFQAAFRETAYRTGDIVTLAADGANWLYVGRRDHMVKSRGYRIELGEIEVALHSHPGVEDAAVVAVPDDLVGTRIRAFVVLAPAVELSDHELETHCGRLLPPYMVPETIEVRDELPKTSTGKTDRPSLARA